MRKKWDFRKIVNTLHLWVGVPCALILFIVCLTGTLYVFQKEITRWIDADKYRLGASAAGGARMDAGALVGLVEAANPGLKVTVVQIPAAANEAWLFTVAPPVKKDANGDKEANADKAAIKKQTRLLIVDPYTGMVRGDAKTSAYRFFDKVIELHRWLLLDHSIGAVITGTSAMLFVLLEITGLILWLPAKLKAWKKWNAWKPGFAVKFKAGWKRVNHDLHKTFGFYTFLLITILGLTGPYFGFEWYRNGVSRMMGVEPVKKEGAMEVAGGKEGEMEMTASKKGGKKADEAEQMPASVTKPKPKPASLPLDSMLVNAAAILPYNGDIRLNLPKGAKGAVALLKAKTGFFASAAVDRIDFVAATGAVKKIDRFAEKTTGAKLISLMRAIHTGEIFGTFSKIIYFLVCLVATSLPVTGIFIWLNKRKKKLVSRPLAGADKNAVLQLS